MNINFIIILKLIALLIIFKVPALADIPPEFFYQGKPIDPNCILEAATSNDVALAECSKHKDKIITTSDLDGTQEGYIGYSYKNIDNSKCNFGSCWIYYKYIGKINNLHVVLVENAMGSTGRFKYINYFKVSNNHLHLARSISGGDRSFGGIIEAKIENNELIYRRAMTPLMFFNVFKSAKFNNLPSQYDNGIPDCAVCQFAITEFKGDKLESVTLTPTILSSSNSNVLANCFNSIHQNYIDSNHLTLTPEEAEEFVKIFYYKCNRLYK